MKTNTSNVTSLHYLFHRNRSTVSKTEVVSSKFVDFSNSKLCTRTHWDVHLVTDYFMFREVDRYVYCKESSRSFKETFRLYFPPNSRISRQSHYQICQFPNIKPESSPRFLFQHLRYFICLQPIQFTHYFRLFPSMSYLHYENWGCISRVGMYIIIECTACYRKKHARIVCHVCFQVTRLSDRSDNSCN